MKTAARSRIVVPFPNGGRRTIKQVAQSAIPSRTTMVVALLAACVAVGIHVLIAACSSMGISVGRGRLEAYAHTFEILPIWLLIGGALHQVAARLVTAWDDFTAWRVQWRK